MYFSKVHLSFNYQFAAGPISLLQKWNKIKQLVSSRLYSSNKWFSFTLFIWKKKTPERKLTLFNFHLWKKPRLHNIFNLLLEQYNNVQQFGCQMFFLFFFPKRQSPGPWTFLQLDWSLFVSWSTFPSLKTIFSIPLLEIVKIPIRKKKTATWLSNFICAHKFNIRSLSLSFSYWQCAYLPKLGSHYQRWLILHVQKTRNILIKIPYIGF